MSEVSSWLEDGHRWIWVHHIIELELVMRPLKESDRVLEGVKQLACGLEMSLSVTDGKLVSCSPFTESSVASICQGLAREGGKRGADFGYSHHMRVCERDRGIFRVLRL